jgi:hypothetical protein
VHQLQLGLRRRLGVVQLPLRLEQVALDVQNLALLLRNLQQEPILFIRFGRNLRTKLKSNRAKFYLLLFVAS